MQKIVVNITRRMLRENVRSNELVTNGTIPDADWKAMLVVAFDSSLWIITIPQMGAACIVGSIAGKMGLVSKKKKKYEFYVA